MSIALVVTSGYGNGTLSGTVAGVTLRGYDIGEAVIILSSRTMTLGALNTKMYVNVKNASMMIKAENKTMVIT